MQAGLLAGRPADPVEYMRKCIDQAIDMRARVGHPLRWDTFMKGIDSERHKNLQYSHYTVWRFDIILVWS